MPASPAEIAFIIDDLGNSLAHGRRVIALPAPVALAILPHTAYSTRLADEAKRSGKEVLLHLPMQPLGAEEPGPGVVEVTMPAREVAATLDYDLRTVPHAVGVNNHMGSRMTRDAPAMQRLLDALRARGGLFFVDSVTGTGSTASGVGHALGVRVLVRDVFLDRDRNAAAIRARLEDASALATRRGYALAIGHPYPETLAALEAWLSTMPSNLRIVSPSELLKYQDKEANHGNRTRPAGAGL